MLSRTADNLYWLSRYVERAENLARILDAANRLSAVPTAYGGSGTNEWESALATAGVASGFFAANSVATPEAVIDFIAFSPDNPCSIKACFDIARANARAVRTALTMEMWESINGAWLELYRFDRKAVTADDLSRFVAFIKEASLRFDGTGYRTMLRRDTFWFSRLGILVERADNTARLLDVKYHVLLPDHETVGGGVDYYQWASLLRAVSALTSYHWIYRESLKPWLVAELLILRQEMPRSLANCYENITRFLDLIGQAYGRQGASQRHARAMHAHLKNANIKDIFQSGLHEFILDFIAENNKLGAAITEQYLT